MFSSIKGPVPVEVHFHRDDANWKYSDLDSRQREIAAAVREKGTGRLLLSEVAPVITHGRRTLKQDILFNEHQLKNLGISLHSTDRGGLATYHGPGQWVLFPVDHLEALTGDRRGVRKAVEALLEIALQVGLRYSKDAHIRSGAEQGVWTNRGKFAAVGIHIERGVLLHGLAVNGYRTETSFQGLRPCGLDAPIDFLLKTPTREEFEKLGELLILETFKQFWCLSA